MAKKSGQEALNRARSGRAGRKSGTNVQKNPILELGETAGGWLGGAARGVVEGVVGWSNSQARTFTNPYINAAGRAIGKNPNLPVSGKGEAISNTAWAAVDIVAPTAGRVVAKGVGKVVNNPAVRAVVKGYTPVLRKTVAAEMDAMGRQLKMMTSSAQTSSSQLRKALGALEESQAESRRLFKAASAGGRTREASQQMLREAQKRNQSLRRFRADFIETYQDYNPMYEQVVDAASRAPMTRAQINKDLLQNAKLADIADQVERFGGSTESSLAKRYLRAKGSLIRDSVEEMQGSIWKEPGFQEERAEILKNQLMRSRMRREFGK